MKRSERPWVCRKCGYKNQRAHVKCRGVVSVYVGTVGGSVDCDARRPKRPVRAHQRALTDNTYQHFVQVAREVHGVTDESCCVCGKPRSQERHHARDHDHRTGQARGLACGGNSGCNLMMLPWITSDVAWAIKEAMERAGDPSTERWLLISSYLQRVEAHYVREGEDA